MRLTTCDCEDQRHTLARVGDRIAMRCMGCGTLHDIEPATYEPILDAADKPAVRRAVAVIAILGLLMAGVICLHCDPSPALWAGCGLVGAGTALAVALLVRGEP